MLDSIYHMALRLLQISFLLRQHIFYVIWGIFNDLIGYSVFETHH